MRPRRDRGIKCLLFSQLSYHNRSECVVRSLHLYYRYNGRSRDKGLQSEALRPKAFMAVVKKRAETANSVILVGEAVRFKPHVRALHRLHEHQRVLVVHCGRKTAAYNLTTYSTGYRYRRFLPFFFVTLYLDLVRNYHYRPRRRVQEAASCRGSSPRVGWGYRPRSRIGCPPAPARPCTAPCRPCRKSTKW